MYKCCSGSTFFVYLLLFIIINDFLWLFMIICDYKMIISIIFIIIY